MIKHGAIIPLIGGMSYGAKLAFENDPQYAITWGAFAKNESHFKKNFPTSEYVVIPSEDYSTFDFSNLKGLDVIHSVPPCAALSSLNSSWKNPKMKGSNAESTKWMHYSTEIALEQLRPKVFIFENAPGLLQKAGEEMRQYLIDKAKKYNYSISFLFTDSLLHGVPQSRKRTFVFFWDSQKAPKFEWFKRDRETLENFIVNPDDTVEDTIFAQNEKLTDNDFYKFVKHKLGNDWRSIKHKTLGQWVWKEGLIDEMISFSSDPNTIRILNHWKKKVADDKGFWDSTPILSKNYTNAVIAKNIGVVHPHQDRYMTIRELMKLMGLPKDYSLSMNEDKKIVGGFNVICQNVPTTTAKDMFLYIKNVLSGEVQTSESNVLYGNNIQQKEWY